MSVRVAGPPDLFPISLELILRRNAGSQDR